MLQVLSAVSSTLTVLYDARTQRALPWVFDSADDASSFLRCVGHTEGSDLDFAELDENVQWQAFEAWGLLKNDDDEIRGKLAEVLRREIAATKTRALFAAILEKKRAERGRK